MYDIDYTEYIGLLVYVLWMYPIYNLIQFSYDHFGEDEN